MNNYSLLTITLQSIQLIFHPKYNNIAQAYLFLNGIRDDVLHHTSPTITICVSPQDLLAFQIRINNKIIGEASIEIVKLKTLLKRQVLLISNSSSDKEGSVEFSYIFEPLGNQIK